MNVAAVRRGLSLGALLAVVIARAGGAAAATITIVDLDGAGVGLNDPSPTAPAGGNSGTTVGAQRLNAMQYAADVWGARLESRVEIRIAASFTALPCNSSSAVIGETGPNSVHRDFAGAPTANTWYPAALANSLAGTDLRPGSDDMSATFNSAIGTTCAFSATFYYGFDAKPPAGRIDFVSVALHEFGHGLGFLTFVSQSGAKLSGLDDAFMRYLEDHRTARLFPAMTDAERASASVATGNLHWVGPFADALSGELTAGVGPNGHVHMYAPSTYQSGSSVSHVDTAVTPNELMEPSYVGPNHDVALTLEFLEDIGWGLSSGTAPTATATRTASPTRTPSPTRTANPTRTPSPTSTSAPVSPTRTSPAPTATPRPTATTIATIAPTVVDASPTPLRTPICGMVPDTGCRAPVVPGKGLLVIFNSTNDARDTFSWSWLHGAITTKADFGDPLTTDTYELCVYDGAPHLVMHATAPAGGACPSAARVTTTKTKPCWSENTTGFRYLDNERTPSGLQQIVLKRGLTPGTAHISVKGKGPALNLPTEPLLQPVIVQLKNSSGVCWESRYDAPALRNVAGPPGRFKDKSS